MLARHCLSLINMSNMSKPYAALLVGFCVAAIFLLSLDEMPTDYYQPSPRIEGRRGLREIEPTKRRMRKKRHLDSTVNDSYPGTTTANAIYPWAEHNLKALTEDLDPDNDTPLFWHIPKSGGTTAKSMYQCLGMTIANRAGTLPQFGHDHDEDLIAFRPFGKRGPFYINADTTTKSGILRAGELGLVPSGLADIIVTNSPQFAVSHLYDEDHKGRAFATFRHPVKRLVSKFYYLQIADWEKTYSPEWKNMNIVAWANRVNRDNNIYVKFLAGKTVGDSVEEKDLQIAMTTLKERFVVGLTDQMEESFRRFFVLMGIDESNKKKDKCMAKLFGEGAEKKNSNPHPEVSYMMTDFDCFFW
jgi:hypothetical protein